MTNGTDDEHGAPASARGPRDPWDANEELLAAAVHAHQVADQARAETKTAVAARERAEAALLNANRLATIGLLTTSVAHDLGTPLAVITVRAQTLKNGEVPPAEVAGEADVILQQTARMTRVVSEILDLARPKAAIKIPVDLLALRRQVLALLTPVARERNIQLELTGDGESAMVLGDSSRLLQVLTNLVLNAQQSMLKKGTVRIRLGRRSACPPGGAEAEYVALDVEDEGAGIAPEVLPRIFETFFTTKSDGTGLGLAVSKRIASEHGGFIAVASEVGRGSSFTLFLPPVAPSSTA